MRPLFWISGIFFAAEALPDGVRAVLLRNPVLHTTEFVRAGKSREPLIDIIMDAYARVAEGADLVIVEGTGHAGVGSIIGMGRSLHT